MKRAPQYQIEYPSQCSKKRYPVDKHDVRRQSNKMMKPVKVFWDPQIFRNHTLWPLSNCFPPQTCAVWAKYGMGISDVTGNNRAMIKTFTAYHLLKCLISS